MNKQFISIIVPAYNEEQNVERAYTEITKELIKLNVDYEIIFTDNHSTDTTFERLNDIALKDTHVKILRFSRNFGFQRSILTGYRYARGDAAIQIDCDLEDHPDLFSEFIRLWRLGHDVVIGVRVKRIEASLMIILRRLYYRLLDKISDVPHVVDGGDFRLIDRNILNQLRLIDDVHPYVRGLISELAVNQTTIPYMRQKRMHGKSKFPIQQLVKMGFEGIFAHSTIPLQIATCFGIIVAVLTTLLIGVYLGIGIFSPMKLPAGFTTTTLLILFGISLNSIFFGIVGAYIGRIYNQMRKRPLVIIEKYVNIDAISHDSSLSNEKRLFGNQRFHYMEKIFDDKF